MPKRNSRNHPPSTDVNVLAHRMVEIIAESQQPIPPPSSPDLISKIMSEMGKKGGRIGGKRRMETMSPEERSAAALKAARARWKRKRH
jgi:hypothetical protein